ncbi:MAG: GNAT family N-acetyltransferase [Saprospiraceae bacterium]
MIETSYEIRPIEDRNREQVKKWFVSRWKTDFLVSKGIQHFFDDLEGLLAIYSGRIMGIATYRKIQDEIEIISLDSFQEKMGIGTSLLNEIIKKGTAEGYKRIWLVTTNDNTNALRFYQKRGWNLKALYLDSVLEARKLKPSIPDLGKDQIPIRHELELEHIL